MTAMLTSEEHALARICERFYVALHGDDDGHVSVCSRRGQRCVTAGSLHGDERYRVDINARNATVTIALLTLVDELLTTAATGIDATDGECVDVIEARRTFVLSVLETSVGKQWAMGKILKESAR